MSKSQYFAQFLVNRKNIVALFLLVNALTSYYMLISIIRTLQENLELTYFESVAVWAVYCAATVGFSFAGAILADKTQRLHILYFWTFFGVFTSLTLILFENVTMSDFILYSFLSGASFGFGMPSCLALFADTFSIERRGAMSGITFLITNLLALPIMFFINSFNIIINSLITASWRALSSIAIFVSKPEKAEPASIFRRQLSFSHILQDRTFVLYVIPWILFCIINRLGTPIVEPLLEKNLAGVPPMIEPLVGSVFALLGGLLADRIGRKIIVIYGFASLGVAFATIGIAPQISIAYYFFVLINAISAGLLWVMFISTIWGDLSPKGDGEKYYAVGNMPFFVTWGILQLVSAQYLMSIPSYAVFSFASFFLFLAVLPLMYAPETLPEKKIKERELKDYIEKAKKIKKKFA